MCKVVILVNLIWLSIEPQNELNLTTESDCIRGQEHWAIRFLTVLNVCDVFGCLCNLLVSIFDLGRIINDVTNVSGSALIWLAFKVLIRFVGSFFAGNTCRLDYDLNSSILIAYAEWSFNASPFASCEFI